VSAKSFSSSLSHASFSEELFYQLGLSQFGDTSRLRLEPAPSLRSLLEIAVQAEESVAKSGMTKTQIIDVRCAPLSVGHSTLIDA